MKFINLNKYEKITKEHFIPVKNSSDGWIKPDNGGLWASPVDEDNRTEWDNFIEFEYPSYKYEHRIEFILKKDAKIFIIDSDEDLRKLLEKYENGKPLTKMAADIDYEKMSKDYDGILLTSKGQTMSRFSSPGLYGWDVASLLLFNIDVIEEQHLVE